MGRPRRADRPGNKNAKKRPGIAPGAAGAAGAENPFKNGGICGKLKDAAGRGGTRPDYQILRSDLVEVAYLLPGQERCIPFAASKNGQKRVEYSYRTESGALFSCVCRNLDEARTLCEDWMARRERY